MADSQVEIKMGPLESLFNFVVISIAIMVCVATCSEPVFATGTATKTKRTPSAILAASCVSEAGWNSIHTGECAAILHVYLKISKRSGLPIEAVAQKYSAAIKPRKRHPSAWLLHVEHSANKPKKWPAHLKWKRYCQCWINAYVYVLKFLEGDVPDPLPCAVHYGGSMDAPSRSLKRLEAPEGFLNRWYKIKGTVCESSND